MRAERFGAEPLGAVAWRQRGRYLVPLDAAVGTAPRRFWVRRLYAPHGGRERLLLGLARRLPGGSGAALLLGPSEERAVPALAQLERALAAVPPPASRGASWVVVLDDAGSSRDRLVAFRFAAAELPDLVLKIQPAPAPGLGREAEGLARLSRELPAALAATLPEVVAHETVEGLDVLALSALPGTSGYVLARSAGLVRAAGQLEAAGGWLAELQAATRRPATLPLPAWVDSTSSGPAAVELAGAPPAWYRNLERWLSGSSLPAVVAHGDFWPRNLLLPDRPGAPPSVVDWEAWSEAASPLGDLFHFPLALGQVARVGPVVPGGGWGSAPPLAAFRATFVDPTPLARRVARYAAMVAAGLGLPEKCLAPLFRLYLLQGARGELSVPAPFDEPAACLAAYHLLERSGCVFSG